MDRVVLDTDVSSLSLKRRLPSHVLTRLIGKQPCITFVTLGELSQWAELRRWGRRNRGKHADPGRQARGRFVFVQFSCSMRGRNLEAGKDHLAVSPGLDTLLIRE